MTLLKKYGQQQSENGCNQTERNGWQILIQLPINSTLIRENGSQIPLPVAKNLTLFGQKQLI
jgi:hypothetical protein